jgi:cbb3-type cytochrome oxidase maturation protein
MSALYVVLPLAILIVAVAIAGYVWSVRSGQMDDLDTPASQPLRDDLPRQKEEPPPGAPEDAPSVPESAALPGAPGGRPKPGA